MLARYRNTLLLALAVCTALWAACDQRGLLEETGRPIGATINAIHDAEIELDQLARTRSTTPEVRELADKLLRDHSAMKARQNTLFDQLGIAGVEDEPNPPLRSDARAMADDLSVRRGSDFDSEFLADQVLVHQRALNLLDNDILPRQLHYDLRAELVRTRAGLDAHLQELLGLESRLRGLQSRLR